MADKTCGRCGHEKAHADDHVCDDCYHAIMSDIARQDARYEQQRELHRQAIRDAHHDG